MRKAFYAMKQVFLIVLGLVSLFIGVSQTHATEKMVFDSTDTYLGACQLTNKSAWEIQEDLNVTKFEVWYNWNQGESSLPVKIFFNGEPFASFEATRGNCDPYQKQWCNADFQINKLFPKGKYTTEIPNARQCLKPGGTGAIRLYVDDDVKNTIIPSQQPTIAATMTPTIEQIRPIVVSTTPQTGCSCNQSTIVGTAAATSILSSLLIHVLLKKRS
jgi:hypothetical protein